MGCRQTFTCPVGSDNHVNRPSDAYTLGVLCGGQGSRMGGADKGWLPYGNSSFVETSIRRFRCESLPSESVIISANRNLPRYQALGVQVVADQRPGFAGPLAGLEAILSIARSDRPLVLLACDMPALPADLATRLVSALSNGPEGTIAIANDGERAQPLCMALYPSLAYPHLKVFLDRGGRGVFQWLKLHRLREALYCNQSENFCNVNEPHTYQSLTNGKGTTDCGINAQPLHFGYDPRHEKHRPCEFASTP